VSDIRLLWTQGRRATIEIPRFLPHQRNFARMALVGGIWRVAQLYLTRPCDEALRCS